MGEEKASSSTSDGCREASDRQGCETQVVLNVYDLTPANQYTRWFGFGIFHSGIEVHGMEYGFGAHDLAMSGVFEVEPRSCPGFIFRCSMQLGNTKMSFTEFRLFIEAIASEYHGNTYNLISKNCNHFTDDISWRLVGKRIPGWVNRLARVGAFCSCMLPDSLQISTVKQLHEYHSYPDDDDRSGSLSIASSPDSIECDDDAEKQGKHLLSPKSVSTGDVSFIKEIPR